MDIAMEYFLSEENINLCVDRIRSLKFSAKEIYDDLDFSVVYCFEASDLIKVMAVRNGFVLSELLPPYLSLQEMIGVWVFVGLVKTHTFPLLEGEVFRFDFISHMHAPTPDKLGADVVESINAMGNDIVWMDLCSMCQEGVFNGYNYELHTRPVVENLHLIVKCALEGRILLNIQDSKNPDKLNIRHLFGLVSGKLRRIYFKIEEQFISQNQKGNPSDYRLEDFKYILQFLNGLSEGFFPTNEYFGRLWCYVERLAMREDSVFIYPSRQRVNMIKHCDDLWWVLKCLQTALKYVTLKFSVLIDLEEAQNLLVQYTFRCNHIFGSKYVPCGDFANLPRGLGPFSQVELLTCACDADRITVAKIEMQIRYGPHFIFPENEWISAFQICLGAPVVYCADGINFREKIGRARLIEPQTNGNPSGCIITDASILFSWIKQLGFLKSGSIYSKHSSVQVRNHQVKHSYVLSPCGRHWNILVEEAEPREERNVGHYTGYECSCHFYSRAKDFDGFVISETGKCVHG